MKARLAALGLVALVAVAPARAAPALGGGTTVTVDGTTVTITVHIDLCCFDDAGTTLVAHIMNEVRAAQDMWNKALAQLPAHGCFDVKVVFDARLLNQGDPWNPGYHRVRMILDKPGRSEVIGGEGEQNDDFVAGYTETLHGTFYASDMTTGTWAHEIGHLLGLGDDYYEHRHGLFHPAFSCLPGRGGTLMCNDITGKIDQGVADRLVDILNKDGLLPKCWYGTLKGHGEGNIYNDDAEVSFKFTENDDGTITGKARAKVTSYEKSWANCRHTRKPPDPFDFAITGRRVDQRFHLELENPRKPVVMSGTCSNGSANTITANTSGFLGAGFGEAFLRPRVDAKDGATNILDSKIGDVKVDATIELHQATQK